MKERYFSPQSIHQQAGELYRQVAEVTPINILPIQPGRSALLVLDMQAYFLEPASHAFVPSAEAIVEGISQLADAMYARQLPLIFTRHINTTGNAGMMSSWWKDVISVQDPLSEIIPAFDLTRGMVIQKSQYDAFYGTDLDDQLHRLNVKQVIICGVMTHLCCETTARSAFVHGYEVIFPVDGTATYNLAYHRASLVNLAHGFASPVMMKDIMGAIRGAREG